MNLSAFLGSPVPEYRACTGYGYTGRERSTAPLLIRDAMSLSGAIPLSSCQFAK
jgi:hypothetical protein